MSNRKPISSRTRFEIFKRDEFTCAYCGGKPPSVVLHVDHIVPVSNGGTDARDNLVTSCSSCNLGKSNIPLSSVPESLSEKAARIKEAEKQLRAYRKILAEKEERERADMFRIIETMLGHPVEYALKAELQSVGRFIDQLGYEQCMDAARISSAIYGSDSRIFRYFCGVCWRKIRDKEES